MTPAQLWKRYQRHLCVCPRTGIQLDISRMTFGEGYLERMAAPVAGALEQMAALESGAIANPDEQRMVGHYWLRAPERAPSGELTDAIKQMQDQVRTFVSQVHSGDIRPESASSFDTLAVVGIGGSALGPQLVADALGTSADRMGVLFLDNTDPDGFDRTLAKLGDGLRSTLTVVISKSGGTVETRNGMLEIAEGYAGLGLDFSRHAVAITGRDSALCQRAHQEKWLATFPMWDWVGGRTSVTSSVGILPAALQGLDVDALLAGAGDMDETTRGTKVGENPAALMALMWHHASNGRGAKDLVILPYKDRLALMARYLQQLVMESLGKELNLDGQVVNQGLTVYGNKGATDQHAYVQQLREGVANFFVTFIEVLRDRPGKAIEVEPGVTSGDFLLGLLLGTRTALHEKGRASMTISLPEVNARTLGAMIALYERTVGLYASLIHVNAYHQPGVEAGKLAAGQVIDVQCRLTEALEGESARTAEELAQAIGAPEQVETVYKILEHLRANPDRGVVGDGSGPSTKYRHVAVCV
ncbi:MAG: glucose-6-phosphate isomerase [bacterium]|nr:glucose-6-phosphate isomerase [bacterium]